MTNFQSIVLFDVQSEYPNMMIMANLHGEHCDCCTDAEKWRGDGFFKVHGAYCRKNLSKVDALLLSWLKERLVTKDPQRKYGLKIMLNTAYGATGSAKFVSIHSLNAARDTTGLGRQCIQYAIKRFKEFGLVPLYTDTDSVYVGIPIGWSIDTSTQKFDILETIKSYAELISKELRSHFPFPSDTFVLKYEDELTYLQFFQNKARTELMQKHYVYLTKEGKVVVKGLDVVKKTCSALTLKFWSDRVIPKIKSQQTCKFDRQDVDDFITDMLDQGYDILAVRYNSKTMDMYKGDKSLQAQITMMYGPGEHLLVKNTVVGAGKSVKYCTVEEAKKLSRDQLDLSGISSELEVFVE